MKEAMQYMLIEAGTTGDLQNAVNDVLRDGCWRVHGSPAKGFRTYIQAVVRSVRYADKPEGSQTK
jgi:hypothetical protein